MGTNVWRLATEWNGEVVLRTRLDYFRDHFVGRAMKSEWEPPELEVRRGRRKRVPDFVSWMLSAPVISSRARLALEELVEPHAELLLLTGVDGTELYAVNVIALVDCLDEAASQVVYSPDQPGRIMNILAFKFRDGCAPAIPIFKIQSYPTDVFVTSRFVERVRAAGLIGAAFADPAVNPLPLLLRGESVNVVDGLPE